MTEQKRSGSAWPEPPSFFTRYTDDNLEKARLLKQKKVNPADVRLEFPPELLEPPPPIEGSYVIFDQHWQVSGISGYFVTLSPGLRCSLIIRLARPKIDYQPSRKGTSRSCIRPERLVCVVLPDSAGTLHT